MFGNTYYPNQFPQQSGLMQQYYNPLYNSNKQPTGSFINGRIVTNVEEARAAQIDLDGSQWYFPCPSEGKIYSKTINMQGLPIFNIYKLDTCQSKECSPVDTLAARVSELEKIVKELKENGHIPSNEPVSA